MIYGNLAPTALLKAIIVFFLAKVFVIIQSNYSTPEADLRLNS